jgi:hypothetical protein
MHVTLMKEPRTSITEVAMLLLFGLSSAFRLITARCDLYKPGSGRYIDIALVASCSYGFEIHCTARDITFVEEGLMGK